MRFAEARYGAIPINFDDDNDAAEKIIEQTAGQRGVDAVIDAVGFEAKGSTTETILSNLKIEGSSGKAVRQWGGPRTRRVRRVYSWLPVWRCLR